MVIKWDGTVIRKLVLSTGSLALALLFYSLGIASASDAFHDAIILARPDAKVLFLTTDVVRALEIAKLEAQRQNVQSKQIAWYAVSLFPDTFLVSLGPPYSGGLDGPEFRVEIRRSDFRVLSVINSLESSAEPPGITVPLH